MFSALFTCVIPGSAVTQACEIGTEPPSKGSKVKSEKQMVLLTLEPPGQHTTSLFNSFLAAEVEETTDIY